MRCITITAIISSFALAACQNADDTGAGDPAAVAGPVELGLLAVVAPEPAGAQNTTQASLVSAPEWAILFAGHDLTSFDALGDTQRNDSIPKCTVATTITTMPRQFTEARKKLKLSSPGTA